MFTGIVESVGKVVSNENGRLVLSSLFAEELQIGQSVSVSGVCLTVVSLNQDEPRTTPDGRLRDRQDSGKDKQDVGFDVVGETLRRTYLGELKEGDRVNLERAMRVDGRLDGHIVQGHVDGVGCLNHYSHDGKDGHDGDRLLTFVVDKKLMRYLVEKGSVCMDGVSLTVVNVGDDWFSVAVVPHTLEVTNLGAKKVGDKVNIEVDVLAKYVERLVLSK